MERSTKKTKELIALALGVAAHCDGCIGFHTEALIRLGASRQEVEETLGMAVYMGGGPSLMYAADALVGGRRQSSPERAPRLKATAVSRLVNVRISRLDLDPRTWQRKHISI